MARARNIKPGFWKNEDLAECTITARLLFVGLWMLADREGRLEDRPKRIKAELFAFDTFEVEPLLIELEQFGFIQRYAINGSRYIQVTKFAEHQTPHYTEKASTIPAPLQESGGIKPQRLQESGGDGGRGFPDHRDDEGGPTPRIIGPKPNMKGGSLPPDSLNPDSLNPDSLNPDSLKASPAEKAARKRASPPAKPALLDAVALPSRREGGQHAADGLAVRKAKDLPLTRTAWDQTVAEAAKAGVTPAEAVRLSAANGWAGFRATWLANRDAPPPKSGAARHQPLSDAERAARNAAVNAEAKRLLGFGSNPNPPETIDA